MVLLGVLLFLMFQLVARSASPDSAPPAVSFKAAEECKRKFKEIEEFQDTPGAANEKATRLTEEEINSYMTLDTESKYGSCLKNFRMSFKQDLMEGTASVDFDCVQRTSSKTVPGLITRLFSGIHVITAQGYFEKEKDDGGFRIKEVRLDNGTLPKFLVEQAISAICMRQEPPFDPMEPSSLPYDIKRVTIHPGYIMVFQ